MAGINLAGAIGMTGKRESVLADLPSIIQHTGDSIAKSIQMDKEKKASAAAAKEKQKQDENAKMSNDFSDFIGTQYKDLTPEYSSTFHDYAVPEANKVMQIIADPSISNSKKQQALEESKYKIQMAHNHYKQNEEARAKLYEMKKEGIYDTSEVDKFLAGIGEDVVENMPNDLMHQPNAVNQNNIVSTKNDSEIVETNVRQPFHKLSYEEQVNLAPQNLTNEIVNKTRLINVTPEQAIESVLPKETIDDIVEGVIINGNTSFTTNEEKKKNAENLFTYTVVEGTNNKTRALKLGFEAAALKELKENHQNLTDAKIAELLPRMTEDKAREAFRNVINPKIGGMINDKTIKYATPKPSTKEKPSTEVSTKTQQAGFSKDNIAQNAENLMKKYNIQITRGENQAGGKVQYDATIKAIDNNITAWKDNPTKKAELEKLKSDYILNNAMSGAGLIKAKAFANVNEPGKEEYHTIDGRVVKGDINDIVRYQDNKRKMTDAVIISTTGQNGDVQYNIANLNNDVNRLALKNDIGVSRNESIMKNLDEKTKQNVSSQPKKEATKTATKFKDDDIVKITIGGKTYTQTAKALKDKGYNESQFTR